MSDTLRELGGAIDAYTAHTASLAAKIKALRAELGTRGDTNSPNRRTLPAPSAGAPAVQESPPAFEWAPGEKGRISLLPIRHDDIWVFRKTIEGLHWSAQEVDLTKDRRDWDTHMSEDERRFVKHQLAFFSRIDIDVLDAIGEDFSKEVDCIEARMVYAAQADQECTHAESYGLQIEAVMSGDERDAVLNAVRTMPIIARMRAWVLQWFGTGAPIGERLIAFGAIEGILFHASFASLQWLRERNLLPGITESNTLITRDEGVHTLHTCLHVRKYLRVRPSQERLEAIFGSLVAILDEFVQESLPVRLIGMNAELMCQYVRFQTDCVAHDMGYSALYWVDNPFAFMDKLTLNEITKTNFFEGRPTSYQNLAKPGSTRLVLDTTPVVC